MNIRKLDPNYTSPLDLEKQEHLTHDRLKDLISSNRLDQSIPRPKSNFIDLMDWTVSASIHVLNDHVNINKFVHNRIIIDGQFLQFCKENSIKRSYLILKG